MGFCRSRVSHHVCWCTCAGVRPFPVLFFADPFFLFSSLSLFLSSSSLSLSSSSSSVSPSSRAYDKTYTINSIDYSDALKGVVVLAQSYGDLKSQQGTKLLFADPSKPEEKNWATIVNLPQSVGGLHDGTISPCGRYYSAVLVVGTEDPKYPAVRIFVVELITPDVILLLC